MQRLWIGMVLLLLAQLACERQEPAAPDLPSNLIVISIDTLRADHVGAYGYPHATTPEIDTLAKDSVLFEKCIAHAPTTLASHASIMTSRLPRHHGASIARKTRLADGVITLAETLKHAGYSTASFNGGIQLDAVYGLDRGFDLYESVQTETQSAQAALSGDESRLEHGVDQALAWTSDVQRPFFIFLHSYEIHHPYTPDDEYLSLFDEGYEGDLPDHTSISALKKINYRKDSIDDADRQHIIDTYDAELRSADDAVGDLIAALREKGLYDNTMIVVTSDHGEEFGEHGMMGWHSHTLHDELLLVPLIVKYPQSRNRGLVMPFQVRGIDIAPTVLSALGIEIPMDFDGADLEPFLSGDVDPDLAALSMFDGYSHDLRWSLRANGWKLNQWQHDRLHLLKDDPNEETDIAELESERARQLRERAEELLSAAETPVDVSTRPREQTEDQLRALGYIE